MSHERKEMIMDMKWLRRASLTVTAGLLAGAVWSTATAQGEIDPVPFECTCLLELGTPVLPNPWPDCMDGLSIVLSGSDGKCNTGNCEVVPGTSKCMYDLDIALTSSSACCFTLKCVSGNVTNVVTQTCTPWMNHSWSNNLKCGQSRIYRVFADDPTSCPANNNGPDCGNQVWYARVKCESGADC
ncbi:MAG: hypothetical protein JNK02_03030 [Planctomycetes bacterium]|nr:hypothetical protein [Planctomycetota bacterium]